MTSQETYLGVPEAAARLRSRGFTVTVRQVRAWARAGRLGDVKRLPNGRAQIPVSKLDQVAADGE
jgi:hypothetical protein